MALRTGKVIIAKGIKLDKSYKDVLSYSESQMLQLVNSKKVAELDSCSFLKPGDNVINTGFAYDTALKCNYLAIQNPYYSNKWFFAFIDDVEYISDGNTRIHYTIDEFSTWWSYWHPKDCFVIREHVNDDTPGANTIPESLEIGEYFCNAHLRDDKLRADKIKVVMASTVVPSSVGSIVKAAGGSYGGIYSGLRYYRFNSGQELTDAINHMVEEQAQDGIYALFIAPEFLVPTVSTASGVPITQSNSATTYDLGVTPMTQLNGYTPRNKKLLTYPFCYFLGTNGNNGTAIYKQELFTSHDSVGDCVFRVFGVLTPGCSIRLVPINYNGTQINSDAGITLGKYPQCNWTTDMYVAWLTQNGLNTALNLTTGVINTSAGIGTGDIKGALGGAVSLAQTLKQVYDAEKMPPQMHGNINSGDVLTSTGENTFHIYKMSIRQEYAKQVDDYFDRLGYKINRIKQPNQTGRHYWNYVQIGAEECIGYPTDEARSVPASSMDIINGIYRAGVTIWHYHDQLGNYNLNNNIL